MSFDQPGALAQGHLRKGYGLPLGGDGRHEGGEVTLFGAPLQVGAAEVHADDVEGRQFAGEGAGHAVE